MSVSRSIRQGPGRPVAGHQSARARRCYRLNVGTIVEEQMLKVRLVRSRRGGAGSTGTIGRGGRMLGQIEEYFIEGLVVGRHFRVRRRGRALRGADGGRGLRLARQRRGCRRCRPMTAASFRSRPISPSACGSCLPTRRAWKSLPDQVREWLSMQVRAVACAGSARTRRRDLSARRQDTISSATRSRAGSRIRRSACC